MVTAVSKSGKYHSWQKSLVVLMIGFVLLGAGYLIPDDYGAHNYLIWGAALVFIIGVWYGVLSFFELIEKVL